MYKRQEVVYADECFARVYDGASGEVLFSQHHSSCTWYENPVVADVDGDFRAEIVVGSNFNCGSASEGIRCPGVGPRNEDVLFAGVRCADDSECLSGRCAMGFCRCTADPQCCPSGAGSECTYVCAAPPAGTPGAGNTCRASRPRGVRGLRVYNDVADRWVRSRMLWNQHPYNVTNVTDDGRIPRSSLVRPNWREAGLNNFRTNVQGTSSPMAAPDATAGAQRVECLADGAVRITARACNRGATPLADGLAVTFRAAGRPEPLCDVTTARMLAPGECVDVPCRATLSDTAPTTVTVTVDERRSTSECRERNNTATVTAQPCRLPG